MLWLILIVASHIAGVALHSVYKKRYPKIWEAANKIFKR